MHHVRTDFDWNDDTIGRLRALWAEGLSTAEIGRRIGVSKNAVVGKSHRLKLTARPSPIRRDSSGQRRRPLRLRCPSLAELQCAHSATPSALTGASVGLRPIQAPPRPTHSPRPIVAGSAPVIPAIRGKHPCCWPIGEPGTPSFRFCNDLTVEGKPYCPDHCGQAYRKVRNHQDAA